MMIFDFTHLKKVNSNYWHHWYHAMVLNISWLGVFVLGTIHAFIPFLFPEAPYRLSKRIIKRAEENFDLDE